MTTIRKTVHLDVTDLRQLERMAKEESEATASTVTEAQIIRRIIREHLKARHTQKRGGRKEQ